VGPNEEFVWTRGVQLFYRDVPPFDTRFFFASPLINQLINFMEHSPRSQVPRNLFLSWARRIHLATYRPIFVTSILILSCRLRVFMARYLVKHRHNFALNRPLHSRLQFH